MRPMTDRGRIVETEAYLRTILHAMPAETREPACSLSKGRMYVYLIYGMYRCFNVHPARGAGEAV